MFYQRIKIKSNFLIGVIASRQTIFGQIGSEKFELKLLG